MSKKQTKGLYILFFSLILISLVPVLSVTYPPTSDLPAHLLGAVLHADTGEPSPASYLSAEWVLSPYILFFLLMYPLIKLFGYLIAAKLILCFYLILFPVGALVFLKTFNPRHWYFAFIAFILTYNYYFEFGFIPFCLGIPLVFLALSATVKGLESPKPVWPVVLCCILATLVYLSHVLNLMFLVVGVLLCILFDEKIVGARAPGRQKLFSQLLRAGIIFLPVLILSVIYFINLLNHWTDFHTSNNLLEYWSLDHQIQSLFRPFFSVNHIADVLIMAALGVTAAVLFLSRWARVKKGFPLYFAMVMIILGVVIPRGSFLGINDASSRFVLIGVIAFLAAIESSKRITPKLVATVASISFLCIVAVRISLYRDVDRQTSAFVRTVTEFIPPNQKIYTVYNAFPGISPPPMIHSIAYYHIKEGGYSPFIFADFRHVAGIKSTIKLPASIEHWEWNKQDTVSMESALEAYEYLVVTTAHSKLPKYFMRYDDGKVFSDSVCSIFKLKNNNRTRSID